MQHKGCCVAWEKVRSGCQPIKNIRFGGMLLLNGGCDAGAGKSTSGCLLCHIGGAALFGEGEMVEHGFPRSLGIPGADGLEDAAVVCVEQVMVFAGEINRPPDALLELF